MRRRLIAMLILMIALSVILAAWAGSSIAQFDPTLTPAAYLPYIENAPTPTLTATPVQTATPIPSTSNLQCTQKGSSQVCAWVSDMNPPYPGPWVIIYGRILVDGQPQAGRQMRSYWKFMKSQFCGCGGDTQANGITSCACPFSYLAVGNPMTITVAIDKISATTWFIARPAE